MSAANQDRTTGDGDGEIARRLGTLNIKDFCDQAVAHLKAGRLGKAYLYASEALELDGKDAKATALRRYALYALHPSRRLFDKALALQEEADRSVTSKDFDKAHELLCLAKEWRCTSGILWTRWHVDMAGRLMDLDYVDIRGEDKIAFATRQVLCLRHLGYKKVPVVEDQPLTEQPPVRYRVTNWPKALRILTLKLARFLNDHVQGEIQQLFLSRMEGRGDELLRLLDEITAPGLHVELLTFSDFFRPHWACIERVLDGRILHAGTIGFACLQLPSWVDANKLLKLPAIRECAGFSLYPRTEQMPPLPGSQPLFSNAALMEWIETSDGRCLRMPRNNLASGLPSFLGALKTDFLGAAQPHNYRVAISCPHINAVAELGVQEERLSNQLGETMVISVGEDPAAITLITQHQFESVRLRRFSSGADEGAITS